MGIAMMNDEPHNNRIKDAKPEPTGTHEGEHHLDDGTLTIPITPATYRFVLCAALNSCNLGYDIGVSTEAGRLIQDDFDLTNVQRELFVGSINFWAMFGGLGSQYFTDRFGRRMTFLLAAILFILGLVIMMFSPNYGLLMFGRLFVGFGVGVGLAIDPLYIAEISPAKRRGELVTWSEIALNVGIVFGFSTGLFLGGIADDKEWRVMFALGIILPVIMIILVFTVLPESPRWLVQRGRDAEAKEILQKVYPAGYNVDYVVQDIKDSIDREQAAEDTVGWGEIWHPTPAIRRMLMVGVGTAVAQQAVGVDAMQYYLLDLLDQSGVESKEKQSLLLVFLGLVKLVFIYVGGKLFDRAGRRPLFFSSLGGCAVAMLIVSIAFFVNEDAKTGFIIFGLALYLAFFSIGMGPGAWLIPSEVFSICIRAKAMSIATCMNRATATLMSSTFLSTSNAMGDGGFFLLLCIICLIVLGYIYVLLPETKGRSLEDMANYFAEITNDNSILEAEAKIRDRHAGETEMMTPPFQTDLSTKPNVEGEII